jgi:hypothetical protein
MTKQATPFETAAGKQKSGLIRELTLFLWESKKWWLVPVVLTLLLLAVLFLLSGSAAAPFVYTLF